MASHEVTFHVHEDHLDELSTFASKIPTVTLVRSQKIEDAKELSVIDRTREVLNELPQDTHASRLKRWRDQTVLPAWSSFMDGLTRQDQARVMGAISSLATLGFSRWTLEDLGSRENLGTSNVVNRQAEKDIVGIFFNRKPKPIEI